MGGFDFEWNGKSYEIIAEGGVPDFKSDEEEKAVEEWRKTEQGIMVFGPVGRDWSKEHYLDDRYPFNEDTGERYDIEDQDESPYIDYCDYEKCRYGCYRLFLPGKDYNYCSVCEVVSCSQCASGGFRTCKVCKYAKICDGHDGQDKCPGCEEEGEEEEENDAAAHGVAEKREAEKENEKEEEEPAHVDKKHRIDKSIACIDSILNPNAESSKTLTDEQRKGLLDLKTDLQKEAKAKAGSDGTNEEKNDQESEEAKH